MTKSRLSKIEALEYTGALLTAITGQVESYMHWVMYMQVKTNLQKVSIFIEDHWHNTGQQSGIVIIERQTCVIKWQYTTFAQANTNLQGTSNYKPG